MKIALAGMKVSITGLGLVASGKRNIKPGHEWESLYNTSGLVGTNPIIGGDESDTYDTLNHMAKIVRSTLIDTKKVAAKLEASTTEKTLRNIWEHVYNHFQYATDANGIEQIRRPARSFKERRSGVDCDCMSVVISSLLHNLGKPISHAFRKAEYNENTGWQHVYVIVPKKGTSLSDLSGSKHIDRSKYYVLDCVVDKFDYEVPYLKKFDKVMKVQYLNGLDFATLNGGVTSQLASKSADNVYELLAGFGGEFSGLNGLSSASNRDVQMAFMRGLKQHLVNTRSIISINPNLTEGIYDPAIFTQRLTALIEAFDQPAKFSKVLGELVTLEEHEQLNGLGHVALGGFFKKIASGIKKVATAVGTGVKTAATAVATGVTTAAKAVAETAVKVVKAIVRYNPVTFAVRNGLILAMKLNVFRMAEKLGYGYWPEEEAAKKGLNIAEWRKNKEVLEKTRKIHKGMGGKLEKFDAAVKAGWKHGVTKHNLISGFGAIAPTSKAPAITTAKPAITPVKKAPTTPVQQKKVAVAKKHVKAAMPLITIIGNQLKPVKFDRVLAKESPNTELDTFYQDLRVNKGGVATKLSLAYKPASEANKYNKGEYAKLLARVREAEKTVIKKGGTAKDLRNAVEAGKHVKITKVQLGAAASTAAASSVLATIAALLTKVDFKAMFNGRSDSPNPTPDEIRIANVTGELNPEDEDEGDPNVTPIDVSTLLSEYTPTEAIVNKLITAPTPSLFNLAKDKVNEVVSSVTAPQAGSLLSKIKESVQASSLLKTPLAQSLIQKVTPVATYVSMLTNKPTATLVNNLTPEKAAEVAQKLTPQQATKVMQQISTSPKAAELIQSPLAQELTERITQPQPQLYQDAVVVESKINDSGKSNTVKYIAIGGAGLVALGGLYLITRKKNVPAAPVAVAPAAEPQPQTQPQTQPPLSGVKRGKSKSSQRTKKVMAITI